MNLFNSGFFKLHSGDMSLFKIDCDHLTAEDYDALAVVVASKYSFSEVEGIPTGGLAFAEALKKHITKDSPYLLLVDDVLTTGGSMKRRRKELEKSSHFLVQGVVVFARGKCPWWITPILNLNEKFRKV